MAIASGSRPPVDPAAEREVAERARHAQRMHRRQMLRRGLVTAVIVGIATGLSLILYPVVRHLRTSWYLTASGLTVQWDVDEDNWMTGGVSSVTHNYRTWNPHLVDPDLKFLPELFHVQSLNLSECNVSEKGLTALAALKELKELRLSRLDQFRYGGDFRGMGDGCVASLRGL